MRELNNNAAAFLELVRAGLWEKEALLASYGRIDYATIYSLAEEQSVVGLVTAGLEQVKDVNVPQEWTLQFIGGTLQIEQRNKAMNGFVEKLISMLREAGVYTLLVKGQGIAQCYEKPLWRSSGDVDLFLSQENYLKAKELLTHYASYTEEEDKKNLHFALTIDKWVVELHGKLHCGISWSAEKGMEKIKEDIFCYGNVRSWMNGKTQVFLPDVTNDVIIIFTHILQHFFYGGIGLRQVCDWCRLLWTYREEIDVDILKKRICEMGLTCEWKALAALTVDYLGMPAEVILFYSSSNRLKWRAKKILSIFFETGNFGHNRDMSYYEKYPFVVNKAFSLWRNTWDCMRLFLIFPKNAIFVWFKRLFEGVKVAAKGI